MTVAYAFSLDSLDPRVSYYPSPQEVGLVESLILDLLDPERKVNALSELHKVIMFLIYNVHFTTSYSFYVISQK